MRSTSYTRPLSLHNQEVWCRICIRDQDKGRVSLLMDNGQGMCLNISDLRNVTLTTDSYSALLRHSNLFLVHNVNHWRG